MTEPLRVAFNATTLLSPLTGVGQYAKSLAEALVATGELDLHFFYAASWTKDIRTTPVKFMGPIKQFIRRWVRTPIWWAVHCRRGASVWASATSGRRSTTSPISSPSPLRARRW